MQSDSPYKDPEYLVSALRQRDTKALSYLYDNYSAALYGCIIRIVSREEWANEILQDVFLQIWDQFGQYDPAKGRLYTWMLNIARNKSIDKMRSKENKTFGKTDSLDSNVYDLDGDESELKRTETIGVESLIRNLTDDEQEVLRWTYFKGYSQSETAEATGIPLGTVKTRMRAALGKLRQMFKLEDS